MRAAAVLLLLTSLLLLFRPGPPCVKSYFLGFSGKGVKIPFEVCKIEKRGVFVDPHVVGTSLAQSAYLAYKLYERRHGPLPYGIIVHVEGETHFVEGRSGDLALYVALFSLDRGVPPLPATGVLDERGNVHPVMFLSEKLSSVSGPVLTPHQPGASIPVKNVDEAEAILLSGLPFHQR